MRNDSRWKKIGRICLEFFRLRLALYLRFTLIFWYFIMGRCYIQKWVFPLFYSYITNKKKSQNTVLGYKKGSNFDLEIGIRSATHKLHMIVFVCFLKNWISHHLLRFEFWRHFESVFRGPHENWKIVFKAFTAKKLIH